MSLKIVLILLALCAISLANAAAPLGRQKRGLSEEADKILKQTGSVDTNNVGQLAELVAKNGAEECLARVICELTHNPRAHGDAGNKFAQSLLKFRQSKHPKVKKYVDAMSYGAKAKTGGQCKSHFSACDQHSTQEIVQVGNKVLRN